MNESTPTCGWNEAKPSFLPDDLSTQVSPGGGHLGSREVSRIEYEQRGQIRQLEAEVARLRADLTDARRIIEGMTEKQARTEAMLRTAAVAHTRLREALSQADNWLQAWLKRHPCNHSAFLICEICEAREALAAKGKNDL